MKGLNEFTGEPLRPPLKKKVMRTEKRNIIEKIWDSHVVSEKPNHPAVFAIDFMLIHEVTSAQAFQVLRERGLSPFDTSRLLATLDHSIPTSKERLHIVDDAARRQVETLRENCTEFGVPIKDFGNGQGIVHVIGPELGITQPGMTLVCGDSHTSTHGAFGALAFGIGTTEVGHVLLTSCLLQRKPKTMEVRFTGTLKRGVYAKDAILALIAKIGIGGGTGSVIEYTGSIHDMSMSERMTICNMSIECGARAGLVSPDYITFEYLHGLPYSPVGESWESEVARWRDLASDTGCTYDQTVEIDLDTLEPMVTWGTNPEQGASIGGGIPELSPGEPGFEATQAALEYQGLRAGSKLTDAKVQWAFLGSCTNGRIEDLRIAAEILQERKVHPDVTFYVVPGSEQVMEMARKEGLAAIFDEAGAHFRNPGCSMCLAMNDDKVPTGERCVSSSNRNFIGRQGKGSRTHLASPATVAASAVKGYLADPREYL